MQERVEPFGSPKVPDHPSEVDFGEASMLGIVEVVHPVPDRLENPAHTVISVLRPPQMKIRKGSRSKRSDTNTGTNQKHRLILQKILTSASERTIDHYSRQNHVNGRDNETSLLLSLVLGIKITSARLGKSASEVANDSDVDAQVIFLWGGGEGEGVPLEVGDLGARKEDILTGSDGGLLLLDLKFHDFGRVLDDL